MVFEGLVLRSQPTDLLSVGVEQLAKGVDGSPLRCAGGWSVGGWRLPESVDLRSDLGLAVEPGAGDACCPGEASEADWLAAASEGPERLGGRASVASWRAWAARRSASCRSAIFTLGLFQGLEGGDDLVQVGQHPAMVGGQALVSGGLGRVDQAPRGVGLVTVDR